MTDGLRSAVDALIDGDSAAFKHEIEDHLVAKSQEAIDAQRIEVGQKFFAPKETDGEE